MNNGKRNRKFLVDIDNANFEPETVNVIIQGYIPSSNGTTLRVRIVGEKAYLTLKSLTKGLTKAFTRDEYEYEIPLKDAVQMLDEMCDQRVIMKERYEIPFKGKLWEVDIFFAENEGLVVAEIELESEDEEFELPDWIGKEVTDDKRYYNALLISNPYSKWKK